MPQQNGIVSLPQREDPGIANRIGSFLRNLGRGREEPQWKIDLREKVARGEADPALLTMGIDPLDKAAMIEGVHGYGHRFSPAQKLWGAGLATGVGGIVEAGGKYPEPPAYGTSIYEMITAPSTPSVKEHWQTGHPWIAGLQTVGAAFPGYAYAKAAYRPLRRGIASIEGAEPLVEGVSELIDPARRLFLKQAGLATAGIAALGAGIGKVAKATKTGAAAAATKAAAPVARVAAKVGQLTQRADIRGFHDWIVNKLARSSLGDIDNPLNTTSGRGMTRRSQGIGDEGYDEIGTIGWSEQQFGEDITPWLDRYGLDADDFNILDPGVEGGRDSLRADALTRGKPKETKLRFDEEDGWTTDELEDLYDELDELDELPERFTVFSESGGAEINLYEHQGVPVIEDEFGAVFVPNEAGLRKLELHQIKQAMGDDLPDSLIENTSQYFRDEGTGFFPGGRGAQEYIEDAHGIPIEKYTDIPLAK